MKQFYEKIYILLIFLLPYSIFCSQNSPLPEQDVQNTGHNKNWFITAKLMFSDASTIFTYGRIRFGGKIKMFNSDNPLFKENNISLGYNFEIGNKYLETGPVIVFSPALFFDLTVKTYLYYGWKILTFSSVHDPIFQSNLDAANNNSIKSTGSIIMITPEIKLKFGPVVILNELDFYYMKIKNADVFYNSSYDHLQTAGFNICNVFTLGFILSKHFALGISNTYIRVFENKYDKLNLTVVFLFYDVHLLSKHDEIKISIGYWIKDKYRYNDDNDFKGFIAWLSYHISFDF